MATLKSRAGAAKLGVPLMILSFLMVVGFMYWLSVTAEPTEVAVVEQDAPLQNQLTIEVFSAAPNEFMGQIVSLENIEISGLHGAHAFFTNLADANGTGYLLHLSDSLVADTTVSVAYGMSVTVTGRVTETTDSVIDAWEQAGAFANEGEKLVAQSTYHLSFIEITMIETPEPVEPGEDDDDSGSNEGN